MGATYEWIAREGERILIVTNTVTKKSIELPKSRAAARIQYRHGAQDITEFAIAKIAADCNGNLDQIRTRLITGPDIGGTIAALRQKLIDAGIDPDA